MKIAEALRRQGVRVSNRNRWLVRDGTWWIVYGREKGQKETQTIIDTDDENLAVDYLLYREEDE